MTEKMCFFTKLIPCRPTFAFDMNDEERAVMMQHVEYWKNLMAQGKVVVFGPVMDAKGPYGIGVVLAESEEEVKDITSHDPANNINSYEIFPMRAVLPQG